MSKTWYVRQGNEIYGPYGSYKLKEMALNDQISPDSELSMSKDGPWKPASLVKGLTFSAPPPPAIRKSIPDPVQTVQLTSKKFKLIYAVGIALGFSGFGILIIGGILDLPLIATFGGLAFIAGILVASYARLTSWWHHG